MNNKRTKVGTLLTMLQILEHFGVTDSMLNRKYGLSRSNLNKVRKGGDLPCAHDHYFKMLLREMECWRKHCLEKKDDYWHHRVKETMFKVMMREFDIPENLVV